MDNIVDVELLEEERVRQKQSSIAWGQQIHTHTHTHKPSYQPSIAARSTALIISQYLGKRYNRFRRENVAVTACKVCIPSPRGRPLLGQQSRSFNNQQLPFRTVVQHGRNPLRHQERVVGWREDRLRDGGSTPHVHSLSLQ